MNRINKSVIIISLLGIAAPVLILLGSEPSYLRNVSGSVQEHGYQITFTAMASDDIPKNADDFIKSKPAIGYSWADLKNKKAVVAVIHTLSGPDSAQNPYVWHVHDITLTSGATKLHEFCLGSIDSSPYADLTINGKKISVSLDRNSLPTGETPVDLNLVYGFVLLQDTQCNSGFAVKTSS